MTPRVAILDYGCGNLGSVVNAVRKVGAEPQIMTTNAYPAFTHIILPGQGAFGEAAKRLNDSALAENLTAWKDRGLSILGICLGMQLMCEGSEEAPGVPGLGWLPYQVTTLGASRLPHVGWNTVNWQDDGSGHTTDFYFCHSYAIAAPVLGVMPGEGEFAFQGWGITRYENTPPFVSAYQDDNLWAVQFHPEKSGTAGLAFLREFLAL